MNFIHSALDKVRDRYAPISHKSTFRATGQITPEEFLAAGDFLVYKFPSWSWADAAHPSKRVSYLPNDKQFLVTRGVPCHRRLDDNFANEAGDVIQDQLGAGATAEDEDAGWLRTGGISAAEAEANVRNVQTLDSSGVALSEEAEEEEIPDIEDDDDDEAIIRDPQNSTTAPLRTYTLYITYTPFYRTPRLYLSGYGPQGQPLPPRSMMEDIVGDYKDKTVTLEDFPFYDAATSVKMASVHPCRHASVMKVLLDRADAALRLRREKLASSSAAPSTAPAAKTGLEGLVDDTSALSIAGHKAGVQAAGGNSGDEWEVLQQEEDHSDESAIRVDQYLVVFLKFMASVTPGIEHDFTMGV